jgi:murein DD-endopeptidase MepM/ murein hydrolase activator NlpD
VPAVRLDGGGAPPPGGAPAARPGTYHELQRGQTLYSLARRYHVPLATLLRANGITDPTGIRAGTAILIPAPRAAPPETGRSPDPERLALPGATRGGTPRPGPGMGDAPAVTPLELSWPLRGRITAGFGRRGKRSHHDGLDIDGVRGQEVRAAASGTVLRAGFGQRYGKLVIIDHGDGVTTLYAHASRLLVRPGDRVEQGEPVAEVGRTGNARGTHLHFEVRLDGRPVDPLRLLAPDDVVRAGAH